MCVGLGAFDGDPGVRPSRRQFVADAAVWEPIPDDGLPRFDEAAHADQRSSVGAVKLKAVFVDRVNRFAFEVDEESGRTFVSIPVRNQMIEYTEWYEVDRETFARFTTEPALAHGFVVRARNRELDHLLLLQPGTDRGVQ